MSQNRRLFGGCVVVIGLLFLLPNIAAAQSATAGTIAGTTKDTTGAILPGVTVEASSDVLIEKTRSAVTDGSGAYKILDLRPGTYTVTFSLPGFSTVKREGLELSSGFTANVTVEMKVGAVEETVTVTGASPVVDVQNVRYQQVLTREVWDALPTGKTLSSYVQLTLGATMGASGQDVGGTKGDKPGGGASFSYHGAGQNDQSVVVDGMAVSVQTTGGGPWTRTTVNNDRAFEETTIGSGISAEQETAGIVINMTPREGGNRMSGSFALNGSATRFQSDNLTPDLVARGVPVQGKVQKLFDASGSGGGPLKKDRLWFYASERWWNAATIVPGAFFNKSQDPVYGFFPTYSPDVSRPAINAAPNHNTNLRLTFQPAQAHKLAFFGEIQSACNCYFSASSGRAPEAAHNIAAPYGTKNVFQGNWNYVKGNRWLFSVGNSSLLSTGKPGKERVKEALPNAIALYDLNTSFAWNNKAEDNFGSNVGNSPTPVCCTPLADGRIVGSSYYHDQKFTATYSTGSHTFKMGARLYEYATRPGTSSHNDTPLGPVYVQVRGGVQLPDGTIPPIVPATILLLINPQGPANEVEGRGGSNTLMTALYAQEQWTLNRLTLNLGVRYDGMRGSFKPYTSAANNYVGSFSFPALKDSPNWNDIAPRIAGVYDLFGNGKTAVKASWGRFVVHQTGAGSSPSGAVGSGGGMRPWNDTKGLLTAATGVLGDGDFFPDCNLQNPLANGECGAITNLNRGVPTAPTTFYDRDILVGWGVRPFLWNSSVSVQQELRPGFAVNVGYFRTTNGNITVADNRKNTPADYESYCVTAPTDARLGSVSGSQLCGLTDITAAALARGTDTYNTSAEKLGVKPVDSFNGVDIGVNARFAKGGSLSGGVSTGNSVTDSCYTIDKPFRPGYCRNESGWAAGTQVKLLGNYPLPWWGVQLSATFQNLTGPNITASQSFTAAAIATALGHPTSSGLPVSIALLTPNSLYDARFNQTDFRVTKSVKIAKLRAQGQFDIYNLMNSSAVLAESGTFGATWLRPSSILGARLLKFGVQLDWK